MTWPRIQFWRMTGVQDDRWLRGNACDPQRVDPLAGQERRSGTTPIHPHPLRHRCLIRRTAYTQTLSSCLYLQQIRAIEISARVTAVIVTFGNHGPAPMPLAQNVRFG